MVGQVPFKESVTNKHRWLGRDNHPIGHYLPARWWFYGLTMIPSLPTEPSRHHQKAKSKRTALPCYWYCIRNRTTAPPKRDAVLYSRNSIIGRAQLFLVRHAFYSIILLAGHGVRWACASACTVYCGTPWCYLPWVFAIFEEGPPCSCLLLLVFFVYLLYFCLGLTRFCPLLPLWLTLSLSLPPSLSPLYSTTPCSSRAVISKPNTT
jgi:hypothetical protein